MIQNLRSTFGTLRGGTCCSRRSVFEIPELMHGRPAALLVLLPAPTRTGFIPGNLVNAAAISATETARLTGRCCTRRSVKQLAGSPATPRICPSRRSAEPSAGRQSQPLPPPVLESESTRKRSHRIDEQHRQRRHRQGTGERCHANRYCVAESRTCLLLVFSSPRALNWTVQATHSTRVVVRLTALGACDPRHRGLVQLVSSDITLRAV